MRAIGVMHDPGETPGRGLQLQMIVVVHQAIGVNDGGIWFGGRSEVRKKFFPVTLILENYRS
jgi:hypothetical protein